MSTPYRIIGFELSPYSVKVRSYFRYKEISHEWISRNAGNMEEFTRRAKLPLIPLVITPDDEALQDSTPILEKLEAQFPEPSIHPEDPALAFLSALIEEYGDEWGNKAMFHYRWWYEADQESAAQRIATGNLPGAPEEAVAKMAAAIRKRMVPRLSFVGSHEGTRDQIERSYERMLAILEPHLEQRPYLFGGRPAFGDFGLAPQLQQCLSDPTAGARMREVAPNAVAWVERMLSPQASDDFEAWSDLAPTLAPLLRDEVAGLFLPWSTANAEALGRGDAEFSVELEGQPYQQAVQKYHARSLGVLRARYQAVKDRAALDPVLEETGCLPWVA